MGHALTAQPGTWSGTPTISFSYRWQDCNALGEGCMAITGATAQTYTVAAGDAGSRIRVLVTASNAAGTASAAATPTEAVSSTGLTLLYSSEFGMAGSRSLEDPVDVATQPGGDIVVLDRGDDSVYRYGSSDEYLGELDTSGHELEAPDALTVDNAGDVWVLDSGHQRVEEFSPSGEYLTTIGEGEIVGVAEGIAVGREGDIWVSDTSDGELLVFNTSGSLEGTVGTPGTEAGELGEPEGLAVDASGDVWVADWENNRVAEYTAAGTFIRTFGVAGSREGEMSDPYGLAIDHNGDVIVAEAGNDRIQAFTSGGEPLGVIGGSGSGSGQYNFYYPVGAAFDGSGDLLVADPGNSRVQTWTAGSPVAPTNVKAPEIDGDPAETQTVSAVSGQWSGTLPRTFAYQWELCNEAGEACSDISGATASEYTIGASELGRTLRVMVTAKDPLGEASVTSAATAPIVEPAPPANVEAPKILGVAGVGDFLYAEEGTWSGTWPFTFTYQWQRCNTVGETCMDIPDATEWYYVPTSEDEGSTLRVEVTAANGLGSTSAISELTSVIGAKPPASVSPPTISGLVQDEQTLTANHGTWSGTTPIGYSYQWQTCNAFGEGCLNVSGATEATFALAPLDVGDTLRVHVTATNAAGSATETSAVTATVAAAPPAATTNPTISGASAVGVTLAASSGAWHGTPPLTYGYQWLRCESSGEGCSDIPGATSREYTLVPADLSKVLRVQVTATNAGGSASATSAATPVITTPEPPADTSTPRVAGEALEGTTLEAEPGTWSGTLPISYHYQWQLCESHGEGCSDIEGATSATYELPAHSAGSTVRVVVEATNLAGSASATSTVTAAIIAATAPENTVVPTLTGKAFTDQTLTLTPGTWSGSTPIHYGYQWQRCNAGPVGGEGYEEGQLYGPLGLASDGEGDVWVVDSNESKLVEYDDAGAYLREYDPSGRYTSLHHPRGVAVAASGDLWIADTYGTDLKEVSPSGEQLDSIGTGSNPEAITISGGDIWVLLDDDKLAEYGESGALLREVGGAGTGHGQFVAPTAIAADHEGDVWVADTGNHRIQELGPEGEFLRAAGSQGTGAGQFASPEGIAVEPDGEVWVADAANHRLERFDGHGEYQGQASLLEADTGTQVPALAIGSEDSIWVLDADNDHLEQLSSTGAYEPNETCAAIPGATSSTYETTATDADKSLRATVTASNIAGFATAGSAKTAPISPLVLPIPLVAPAIHGTLEVEQQLTATEGEWDSGGEPLLSAYQWQRCNITGESCQDIPYALGESYRAGKADIGHTLRVIVIAEDAAGEESSTSAATGVITGGHAPSVTSAPAISGHPIDGDTLTAQSGSWNGLLPMTFAYHWESCNSSGASCALIEGADGETYEASTAEIGRTLRVKVAATNEDGSTESVSAATALVTAGPPANRELPSIGGTAAPGDELSLNPGGWAGTAPLEYAYQWESCTGGAVEPGFEEGRPSAAAVAIDSNGNLWASDPWQDRLAELTASGEYLGAAAEPVDPPPISVPQAVAADAHGDVWVAESGSDSVREYDEAGIPVREFGWQGLEPGEFEDPSGITVSPTGDIWVLDGSDRVQEFTPDGEYVTGFGTSGSEAGELQGPTAIVADGEGNLWISSSDGRLQEFNAAGHYIRQLGPSGPGSEKFDGDVSLAVGPNGDLWVANRLGDRIYEFDHEYHPIDEIATGTGDGPTGIAVNSEEKLWVVLGELVELSRSGENLRTATSGTCTPIAGATGSTFTVTEAQAGRTIRAQVKATNTEGTAQATTATSPTAALTAPVSEAPPSTAGAAEAGGLLTASAGTWTPSVNLQIAYQWQRCNAAGEECAAIEGATERRYAVAEADIGSTLRVLATATDAAGTAEASSSATSVVKDEKPLELAPPQLTGTPAKNDVLTAQPGSWEGSHLETSYQWERCNGTGSECAPIAAQTGPEYELEEEDVSHTVRVRVGVRNARASLSDVSEVTPTIVEPSALSSIDPPTIERSPEGEGTLTAQPGIWSSADASYYYQWQECDQFGLDCHDITGATSQSFTPTEALVGDALRVTVTADGLASRTSAATEPLPRGAVSPDVAPRLQGEALAGGTLTVANAVWAHHGALTYSYQWERCTATSCSAIEGATATSYTLTSSDVSHTIRSVITAAEEGSEPGLAVTAPSAIVQPEAATDLTAPSISGTAQTGETLEGNDGIWSGAEVSYTRRWERCTPSTTSCAAIEAATGPAYEVTEADAESSLRLTVTGHGPGSEEHASSSQTQPVPHGAISTEQAAERAHETDPALFDPSQSTTIEGETITPALIDGKEAIEATGTLTGVSVSKEQPGMFTVETSDGELDMRPLQTSPSAGETPTIVNGSAALLANTWPDTDTVIRADALGATALLQMRSAEAPSTFTWELGLGANQQLQPLPNGSIAVTDRAPTPVETSEEAPPEERSEREALEAEAGGLPPSELVSPMEPGGSEEPPAEAEEEPNEEPEVPAPSIPTAPTLTFPAGSGGESLPQPQDTRAQYEADTTAMSTAETLTGSETAAMVVEAPTARDASGAAVPVTMSAHDDDITIMVHTTGSTKYPVIIDPSVASHTRSKIADSKKHVTYGLSDNVRAAFDETGPAPETFPTLDPNLKHALGISTARYKIPYTAAGNPIRLADLKEWLATTEAQGLKPYVTIEACDVSLESCPLLEAETYKKDVGELMTLFPQVKIWGAWNEPDRKPSGHGTGSTSSEDPLAKDAPKAAEFWEIAHALTEEHHCGKCTVVAGEFQEASPTRQAYISNYIGTFLCPVSSSKCARSKWPAAYRKHIPLVWGLHDYHDVDFKVHQEDLKRFTKALEMKGTADARIWITEAGVELQTNKQAIKPIIEMPHEQEEAARRFLGLATAPKIERVYYYDYEQPSPADLKRNPHYFDSGLITNTRIARPAYCVIAYTDNKCPPTVATGPNEAQVGANTSGGLACSATTGEKFHEFEGYIDPNGRPTIYWFVYGPGFTHRTEYRYLPASHVDQAVAASGIVEGESQGPDENCKSMPFRIVATHQRDKAPEAEGKISEIEFGTREF